AADGIPRQAACTRLGQKILLDDAHGRFQVSGSTDVVQCRVRIGCLHARRSQTGTEGPHQLADRTPGLEHGGVGGKRPRVRCTGGALPIKRVLPLKLIHPRHGRDTPRTCPRAWTWLGGQRRPARAPISGMATLSLTLAALATTALTARATAPVARELRQCLFLWLVLRGARPDQRAEVRWAMP